MRTERNGLPHVTDILKSAGVADSAWFTDLMRDRGTAIHLACQLILEGDLDPATLDPEIVGPVGLFRRFLDEIQPEVLAVEEEVESPLGYCGRLDLRLRIGGREGILDIKGQPTPANPLQLAGYALCFPQLLARWNLYLRMGDHYRLVEHKDRRRDDAAWRACVTLAAWRRDHGF